MVNTQKTKLHDKAKVLHCFSAQMASCTALRVDIYTLKMYCVHAIQSKPDTNFERENPLDFCAVFPRYVVKFL